MLYWFFASLLISCGGEVAEKSLGPIDTGTLCDAKIIQTTPFPDAKDMYYRGNIEVGLSEIDTEAFIQLFDSAGKEVDGVASNLGHMLYFDPTGTLQPSQSYTAEINYCGSEAPVDLVFRTSVLGSPLENGNEMLTGRSFSIDPSEAEVVYPTGVGDILKGLLQNTFLIQTNDANDEEMGLRLTLSMADSLEQNFCVPTIDDFPSVDISKSPYFTIENQDVLVRFASHQMTLFDFSVSGTIAPDASYFGWIQAEGTVDIREVHPIANDFRMDISDADEFCTILAEYDVACEPCPNDQEEYCLPLILDKLEAHHQQMELFSVCDSNCHELCEDNAETCENEQPLNGCN